MPLRFYNTLTRALEPFVPIEPGNVRMYTCGPTIYNFAHIGNFRAYVFEDLLRRYLKYAGFKVFQVMNLTDVDDKTIAASQKEGKPLKEFTKTYADAFFQDVAALGIERAEEYPAATDHIPEMIALIQRLLDKGFAYKSDDGSVYYSIDKFSHYGCLARLDKSGLRAGARVAQDEYDKENVADFALWKAWSEKDGPVVWDAPWGRGRPGWHIECSAMSIKFLGETFDIHTGGVDNIFPHHDDEIAQSEAATGKKFVHVWLHCAHLIVDGKKMSKSAGNFFTLRDLLNKGYSGREIRYVLIATHYRQWLNFTFDGLDGARVALARLDEFRQRLEEECRVSRLCEDGYGGQASVEGKETPLDTRHSTLPSWAQRAREGFRAALDDDLNISGALGVLFDMVRDGNKALDGKTVAPNQAAAVLSLWNGFDAVLGLLQPVAAAVDPEIESLVDQRQAARKAKNWVESDRLRDVILSKGWEVKDTAQGPKLRKM
ncbi:MAG: cysteine--tRNA ligase [bacterium]